MMDPAVVDDFFRIVIEPEGLDGEAFSTGQASIALYRPEGYGIVLACRHPPGGCLRNDMVPALAVRTEGRLVFKLWVSSVFHGNADTAGSECVLAFFTSFVTLIMINEILPMEHRTHLR
ncbi:MAG TPA: hypothetical protein DCG47_09720 [Spirochaetaceae bacterium]|nr:hypothetical protein [Spirochaetaceae bacterium]